MNSTTPAIFIEICNQTPISGYPLIYEFFRLFKAEFCRRFTAEIFRIFEEDEIFRLFRLRESLY